MDTWTLTEPFLIPGRVTDCPDYFEWNGWYYLFAEFVYWMSRQPLGPWTAPESNRLDVLYVPKTAEFMGNRRIYVSWLPDGGWGGHAVFRELVQHEDGTLGTKFVPEMIPATGTPLECEAMAVHIQSACGPEYAHVSGLSGDARIRLHIKAESGSGRFGLVVKAGEGHQDGHALLFDPQQWVISFNGIADGKINEKPDCSIEHVEGLERPFSLDLIMKGGILDACIDNRRTIITRCKGEGDHLFLVTEGGSVTFEDLEIRPLTE